eukprot:TRINITY_DN9589_c0_g1_i6.p1 TRINITY_DN9589_c0_g1~~TRINITY_DN9589_c0_g1_i6.p1  ORF type:complete len:133 (-),score=35.86 TRINITY_DN9589_c0_g1_i6:69-467(-)
MAEVFALNSLAIAPVTSPIQDAVKLSLEYSITATYQSWEWLVKYTVDVAFRRVVLNLLQEKTESSTEGKHAKEFTIPKISTEGIPEKDLLNVGLLSICGIGNGKEVIAINIVSQITKNDKGELFKTLLNPLE